MSQLSTFVLLCSVALALSQSVRGPGGTTKKPFVPPVGAIIDENNKQIDADFPGNWMWTDNNNRRQGISQSNSAHLEAHNNHVNFDTKTNQKGTAGFAPGYVQGLGPNGQVGSGNLFMDGKELSGGLVQAEQLTANLQHTKNGDNSDFDLVSGQHSLVAKGEDMDRAQKPQFVVDGKIPGTNRQVESVLDVYNQQGKTGNGELMYMENGQRRNNVTYNQRVIEGRGSAQDKVEIEFRSKDGRILSGNNWVCESEPEGTSQCKDENGKLVGKTVTTNPKNGLGETLVYDQNNRVIGRAKVRKISERKYVAEVNDGLLAVNVDEITKYDCWDEANRKYGGPPTYKNSKIKVENMDVKYNTETLAGGKKKFLWPDCFKMSADVTLPAGVPPKCVAWEVIVHVLPMGTYDCTDAGTCPGVGRSCYYCDMCGKRNQKILANTEGTACKANAGGRQRIEETVCPTPEGEELLMCQGFDRHLLGNDYYKYNGTLNAELRVWMRGDCLKEDQVRSQFETGKRGIQRTLWAAQYKIDAGKAGENVISSGINLDVSDEDLFAWYKQQNHKDSLIGCQKSIVDYGLGKEGGTDVVIDQMAQLGRRPQIFNEQACPQWKAQNKKEYEESSPKPASSSGSGSQITDLFNRFTGGLGGSSSSNTGASASANANANTGGSNPLSAVTGLLGNNNPFGRFIGRRRRR